MRKGILVLLTISLVFLNGCWDREEIESRAYILGVAIDKYPPVPEGQPAEGETKPSEERKLIEHDVSTGAQTYAMTIQLPIIKVARQLALGQGGSAGGQGSRTWELVETGNSFMEMSRQFATRLSFTPYYGHIQAIVISEKVARQGIEQILDFFKRNPQVRRRVKLFISDQDAKAILDVVPRIEDFSSIYLSKIPMVSRGINSRVVHKTDLGEVLEFINAGQDFILPRVTATKDEIMDYGAAVFRKGRMVGWLDGIDLESVKFIRNLYLGGIVTAPKPGTSRGIMTFEIRKSKTKITPVINKEGITFKVKIDAQGNYGGEVNTSFGDLIDKEYLDKAGKVFEAAIEEQCETSVKKIQREYDADIFQFCEVLRTKKPDYWDKIKGDWREIFRDVKVEVDANVDIKTTGEFR